MPNLAMHQYSSWMLDKSISEDKVWIAQVGLTFLGTSQDAES